jgi:hypothetical protein
VSHQNDGCNIFSGYITSASLAENGYNLICVLIWDNQSSQAYQLNFAATAILQRAQQQLAPTVTLGSKVSKVNNH